MHPILQLKTRDQCSSAAHKIKSPGYSHANLTKQIFSAAPKPTNSNLRTPQKTPQRVPGHSHTTPLPIPSTVKRFTPETTRQPLPPTPPCRVDRRLLDDLATPMATVRQPPSVPLVAYRHTPDTLYSFRLMDFLSLRPNNLAYSLTTPSP